MACFESWMLRLFSLLTLLHMFQKDILNTTALSIDLNLEEAAHFKVCAGSPKTRRRRKDECVKMRSLVALPIFKAFPELDIGKTQALSQQASCTRQSWCKGKTACQSEAASSSPPSKQQHQQQRNRGWRVVITGTHTLPLSCLQACSGKCTADDGHAGRAAAPFSDVTAYTA